MLRNFTLDDATPLIQYDSSWVDGYNSPADSEMPRYQGRSFHVTNTNGATANVTFHGTAIYLYGAKRVNHGYYRVAVDDEPSLSMSGRPLAGAPEKFQSLLFSREGLTNGEHTLRLENIYEDNEKIWLDVDFIVITREVDIATEVQSTIATHNQFKYSRQWSEQNVSGYRNSTARVTSISGETATLNFQGPEILVYGGVGPDFGTFKVQVDSRQPVVLNATRGMTHPPLTLFATSGLGDGQHTLTITNLESGKFFALDYAEYTSHTTNRGGLNASVIGGIVGGVAAALLFLAIIGWYFIRGRKRAQDRSWDSSHSPILADPQWDDNVQVTPYVDTPSHPPLGHVDARPVIHNAHVATAGMTRKTDTLVAPFPTLRSGESSYGRVSQRGLSPLNGQTETLAQEFDAGAAMTLPPLYDHVFSSQSRPRHRDVGGSGQI
ncbi:unnamed protein product [Rhizoctonia solani]|uniref:Transmembrane protein n=1 Tax=Rhizoctonia solani TaxID=456999 RepID=A0A8H2XVT0_9AGAM|nr:unnamed protein product [Rhizoctonia solani]